MIIPSIQKDGGKERNDLYEELIYKCEATRSDRETINEGLRRYYLFGTQTGTPVRYNRVQPHIDSLSSFLYSPDSTKFSIAFSADVEESFYAYQDVLRKKMSELWADSDTDLTFGDSLDWSLVFGSHIIKLLWNGQVSTYAFEPHMMGVLREDIPKLDRQEAIMQLYYITPAELQRLLRAHPNKEKIMATITGGKQKETSAIPEVVTRIVLSSTSPNLVGAANVQQVHYEYLPQVSEELVEMRELWVWDDELREGEGDYRVVTRAAPDIYIFDRKNIFIPGEHPFVKITPKPIYNYLWGKSEVQSLMGLQDWRDKRIKQIDLTFEKMLRPSRIGFGTGGLSEEKALALDKPGGYWNAGSAAAKMITEKTDMPGMTMEIMSFIDTMFNEQSGLVWVLAGRGEEGVRSMGHADILARMASSRIKRRGLIVENSISRLATLMLRLQRQEDKTKYFNNKKQQFLLSQVPDKFQVKVSAHTSSPIFVENLRQQAVEMLNLGAIKKRRYLELIDPPMLEMLLDDLKDIEASEAEIAKGRMTLEASKAIKNLKAVSGR